MLDVERIIRLAREGQDEAPDLTAEQALQLARLLDPTGAPARSQQSQRDEKTA